MKIPVKIIKTYENPCENQEKPTKNGDPSVSTCEICQILVKNTLFVLKFCVEFIKNRRKRPDLERPHSSTQAKNDLERLPKRKTARTRKSEVRRQIVTQPLKAGPPKIGNWTQNRHATLPKVGNWTHDRHATSQTSRTRRSTQEGAQIDAKNAVKLENAKSAYFAILQSAANQNTNYQL